MGRRHPCRRHHLHRSEGPRRGGGRPARARGEPGAAASRPAQRGGEAGRARRAQGRRAAGAHRSRPRAVAGAPAARGGRRAAAAGRRRRPGRLARHRPAGRRDAPRAPRARRARARLWQPALLARPRERAADHRAHPGRARAALARRRRAVRGESRPVLADARRGPDALASGAGSVPGHASRGRARELALLRAALRPHGGGRARADAGRAAFRGLPGRAHRPHEDLGRSPDHRGAVHERLAGGPGRGARRGASGDPDPVGGRRSRGARLPLALRRQRRPPRRRARGRG